VYSITDMPASAFAWSGLEAISDQRFRLIVAPRPELYDYLADPGETADLLDSKRPEAQRLKRQLEAARREFDRHPAATPEADPQLAAQLRSLGYLSGSSRRPGQPTGRDPIDPKDGIALLDEMERAKGLMQAGRWRDAAAALAGLVARNPDNVPFLTQLARAQLGAGDGEAAIATYRRATGLNPGLDFLHVNLAAAYRELGRAADARREYELALELNPRAAAAWFNLAEMAHLAGDGAEERRLLLAAVEAGTTSATIHSRLGQIETAAGRVDAGDAQFRAATELAPGWAGPWLLWGQQAESRGQLDRAAERYRRAVEAEPSNPAALLRLGRVMLAGGDAAGARPYLERARALGAGSETGREAERLLRGP
jgi:Flp pilus assembly protein TadD